MVNPIGSINGAGGVSPLARALLAAAMLDASQQGGRRGGAQAAGALAQLLNNLSGVLNAAAGALNALSSDDSGGSSCCGGASGEEGLGDTSSMERQLEGIMHMAQALMATLMPLMNVLKNEHDPSPTKPAAAVAAQQLQGPGGGALPPVAGDKAPSSTEGAAGGPSSAAPASGGASPAPAAGDGQATAGAGPAGATQAAVNPGDATDKALLNEINRVRQQHRLPVLTESPSLAAASRSNNAANHATRHLDHHNGVINGSRGEITAYDPGGVASTVQGWLDSPGHRAIMLDPNMKHIGVDVSGDYATANFS